MCLRLSFLLLMWLLGYSADPQKTEAKKAEEKFSLPNTCVCVKSLQSCRTLCDPMDCSLPGFSGVLQARILEGVTMPSSRGSSQPRDQTCRFFTAEPPGKPQALVQVTSSQTEAAYTEQAGYAVLQHVKHERNRAAQQKF